MALLAALIAQSVARRGRGRGEEPVSERSKLSASHLRRAAFVYVRQSSQAQVERNVESTARQYALVERAVELGFAREQVVVIDEDLGISGRGMAERSGFARLAAEVALGHAGLVLGLEGSRLARNNVDWYRLLDLCGVTDTVIGDADGLYHPGSFNDRLLLGLKGTMSARPSCTCCARGWMAGSATRPSAGELRRGAAGRARLGRGRRRGPARSRRGDPRRDRDDLRALRRARLGAPGVAVDAPRGRAVPAAALRRAARSSGSHPTYHQIHSVLESPVYAGAYAFGKTRRERYVDEHGQPAQADPSPAPGRLGGLDLGAPPRLHRQGHVRGNRERIAANTRPRAHEPGGAVREGQALLQGIARLRALRAQAQGPLPGPRGHQSPAYHCPASMPGRGTRPVVPADRRHARSTRPSPARCWPRSPPPA